MMIHDIHTRKPHSANFFILLIGFSGLLLLSVIGVDMVFQIQSVERDFRETHLKSAEHELEEGIKTTLSNAENIAKKLISWDETRQQLTDPTYYKFWQSRRLHTAQTIPKYVRAIELYSADEAILTGSEKPTMPLKIPESHSFVRLDGTTNYLFLFRPIFLNKTSNKIYGYLGLKLDFISALITSNKFAHIDTSSLRISLNNQSINTESISKHIQLKALHLDEIDQFKQILYSTFTYIIILIIIIVAALYLAVLILFAKPIQQLNQYIAEDQCPLSKNKLPAELQYFSVTEFNNFSRSLQDYQQRLVNSQKNLQASNMNLERRVKLRTKELEDLNKELEAFSYSVSHDLRAPLRSIDGFSKILLEDYEDRFDVEGKDYIRRVRNNTLLMSELIDDMLNLSRITQKHLVPVEVNLSDIVTLKLAQLMEQNPEREIEIIVAPNIFTHGDKKLLGVVLDNLLENAWKYSSKIENSIIEFGHIIKNKDVVYFVKDNGNGFDMDYVDKIFQPFQRLHGKEFEGTGIGLATVNRVIKLHHGKIWAESSPNQGACFYFIIGDISHSDIDILSQ